MSRFRLDFRRRLLFDEVYVPKRDYYVAQKAWKLRCAELLRQVAQFCLRQIMRNRFEFVALEQQRLARAAGP